MDIVQAATFLFAMILSLSFHEAAHALAAKVQGDDTAEDAGRLTLNPVPHIDVLGTLLLPLFGALTSGMIVGWARPVPVNPNRMRNNKWGPVMVAMAGPFSNLFLCFVCAIFLAFYQKFLQDAIPEGSFFFPLIKLNLAMIILNATLAFFNLLPIPPLDGAQLLQALLPDRWAEAYQEYVVPYGFFILIALLMTTGLAWVGVLAGTYVGIAQGLAHLVFFPA